MKQLIFIVVAFAISSSALACQYDMNCGFGARCVKTFGSVYGYCVGGNNPGNSNDERPARNPFDMTGKQGNTCQFDIQCGPGGSCVKTNMSMYGTCL